MIRQASFTDVPQLKEIWHSCFPYDSSESVDYFFEKVWQPDWCMVYERDQTAVSCVYMLPAQLMFFQKPLPVHYIFAAATLPAYQGQGIFAQLLNAADDYGASMGKVASCLLPADAHLYDYYSRFGYRSYFTNSTVHIKRSDCSLQKGDCGSVGWERYKGDYSILRDRLLSTHDSWLKFDKRIMQYITRPSEETAVWRSSSGGLAYTEQYGNTVFIKELICSQSEKASLYALLFENTAISQLEVRSPASDQKHHFGMLRVLQQHTLDFYKASTPYLGLAID